MADLRRRFERWRKFLPRNTRFLVDQVFDRIVPECERRGFSWYPDYAGGDPQEVAISTIPLQRREGKDWPTIEIQFGPRARPWFSVYFAALPSLCHRLDGQAVARDKATVIYAPVYFVLCKGTRKSLDGQFGYHWCVLTPQRYLRAEMDEAMRLLPVVFELFDHGIPESWLTADFGYVAKHVMLIGSWRINEQRRAAHRVV